MISIEAMSRAGRIVSFGRMDQSKDTSAPTGIIEACEVPRPSHTPTLARDDMLRMIA